MKTLVAGCGYVGVAVGTELARSGHEVFGLRRSDTGTDELKAAGIIPLTGDVTVPETLEKLPTGFDWVINCVSASASSTSDQEQAYRRAYVDGNRNLVNWLRRTSPSLQKFVYTSSTGVYGQDDGSVVDENSIRAPENATGQALVDAEQLLLEAARRDGLPAVILRLAGIYGPGRGYWLNQFLAGTARLEGDGTRVLNMVHRDDVVGAIIAALERGVPGQVYNVVDNEPVSQIELFQWLAARLDSPPPAAAPEPEALSRRRTATNKRVSNRRLREELGYVFKYPTFREGFEEELSRLGEAKPE